MAPYKQYREYSCIVIFFRYNIDLLNYQYRPALIILAIKSYFSGRSIATGKKTKQNVCCYNSYIYVINFIFSYLMYYKITNLFKFFHNAVIKSLWVCKMTGINGKGKFNVTISF